ncbi:interferon alpha-inducible protein 27-like protein 2B [Mercenaria mercenaria]|uniref:interferon alpha-inducible protein 27-like protein 2B n=1 Tax=Mercenaria mercenaria TaxID=6596 RepID=UPI00234EE4D4|nr:interferon alpha-inducible protein 27-like protein 2B [Mercenaria mercenaria]
MRAHVRSCRRPRIAAREVSMGSLVYFVCMIFLFTFVDSRREYTKEEFCPVSVKHGDWTLDYKDGYRCILSCDNGFEPSDCHVIRRDKHDQWERTVPTCVESSMISGKTVAAVGVGAAAVVGAPYALAAAGFGAAGVAAGSLAAWLQGSATAAGSWFALGQSAGAAGIAATTQAGIFGSVTTVTRAATSYFTGCEAE